MDVVESALRDVNLSSGREIVLKPEQESEVKALLADRDVLAVLSTGYGKSLIYQMFVREKNYELKGNAAILVISPLKSIIEDQLQEMELLGYPAKDLANLSNDDIRRCNFKIVFVTAEIVKEKPFRAMLLDSKSKLHRNGGRIAHGRDMDRKNVESSILFLLRLKSICVATRDFDFCKLIIEMHWKFYTTVMICSCILVKHFPLFHCPSPNRYCR